MRYRLERADFESEIDSDLDTGPTTFCCVPRFVALWYRECSPGTVSVADPESDESVHIPESESQVIDPRIPDWRGL